MNLIFTGLPFTTLAAIFGSLVAVFVLFYLLRTKAETIEVPHLRLWEQVLREERARSWWERWKRWFSLLLILLIAASLVLAIGDPRPSAELERGSSTVIVLDQTASMRALDGGENRSRFERAISEATRVIETLKPQDEVSLVTVDAAPSIRIAFTRDHGRVQSELDELAATDLPGDAAAGVELGLEILEGRESSELFLFSDTRSSGELPASAGVDVHAVPIGTDADNIATSGFRLRRYPLAPTEFETMVRVTNASDETQPVSIDIFADGEAVEQFREEVPAQETSVFIYSDLPDAGQRWVVYVTAVNDAFVDAQPLDNLGYASLTDRSVLHVLLVSDGNLYLEAPLLLNEAVRAERMDWQDFRAAGSDALSEFDTFIFDGGPAGFSASMVGDKVYFPALSSDADDSYVDEPIIDRIDDAHHLMRAIPSLRDVNIARAITLEPGEADEIVARSISGAPMIVTRRTGSGNEVRFAFDPAESDLPLRIAFPLLLANITDWFRLVGTGGETSYSVGETIRVRVPEDQDRYTVEAAPPVGLDSLASRFAEQSFPSFDIQSVQGTVDLSPTLAGFYTLTSDTHQQVVAVTSSDPREAFLAVSPDANASTSGQTEASTQGTGKDDSLDLRLWTQLLLVAIGLLSLEWWTWTRRITV